MKSKMLFALLWLVSWAAVAQKSHEKFRIEASCAIEQMQESIEGDYSDMFSSLWNNTLFFCKVDYRDARTVRLFMYDIAKNAYSHCDIDMRPIGSNSIYFSCNVNCFAASDSLLVFYENMNDSRLCFFKKQDDTYVFDTCVTDKDDLFSREIRFLPDGRLLGFKNYPYRRDFAYSTKLTLFDTKTKSVLKTVDVDFPLPGFTFISPYRTLSVSDSSIFLAQRGDYKISEYDFDLNKKGDISYNGGDWSRMPQSLSDSIINIKQYGLAEYSMLFFSLSDKYSCIHTICASNDKLLVFYTKANDSMHYYYDVWRKRGDAWELAQKAIDDKTRSLRHLYERSLFGFGASDVDLCFIGEKLLRIRPMMPDMGYCPKLIYMRRLQKHLLKNPISYVVERIAFE